MIRATTPADAQAIADIYNHYIANTVITFEEEAVSAEIMGQRIANTTATHPWLLAESDGQIAGYAYAVPWRPRSAYRYAVETTVYLHENATGRGIGTRLYEALLQQLRASGFKTALGGIALPNAASIALHEKLGFEKAGQLRGVGYKFGQWIDVGYWQIML